MKKNVKKLLLLIAVVITAVVCFTFSASAGSFTAGGKCGSGVQWLFYESSETLVIERTEYGSGEMYSYDFESNLPSYAKYKDQIKKVVIRDGVVNIGKYTFCEFAYIESLIIANSVECIGSYAFYGCSSLTSITIPDSVTSIGDSAFSNCTSLTSVTIGDSVTTIGNSAFRYCTKLASIIIPDSVTSIGWYAFYDCTSLASITLPFIGGSLTKNCFLGYIFGAQDGYETYNDNYVPLSLKEVILSDKCTSIPSEAFYGCARLTSITIPDSVTTIGDYAFYYCLSLTSITIPDNVTSIGAYAFYECTSLTSITIPDSVTSIGDSAFSNCTSLTSITIPDSVTSTGDYAFEYCTSLTSVTIPDSVTSIGNSAFYECKSLTSITIPDSVTTIDKDAFKNCSSVEMFVLGDKIEYIGDGVFDGCMALKEIHLPASLKSIGDTFYGCSGLAIYYAGDIYQWMNVEGWETVSDYFSVNTQPHIHTEITVKGKAATCKATGLTDGKKCTVCSVMTVPQKTIAKLAHKYSNNCDTACNTCGAKRSISHAYKTVVTTKATLSKNGKTVSKCSVCGAVKSGSTKTVYYPKTIKLSATSYVYNGKTKTPSVTVKDYKGNTLKKDTDYTVKYSSGRKSTGKYTVTVTFKGKYSGTKTLTFTIVPKAVTLSKVTAGSKSATVAWKTTTGASGYQVMYSTSSKFKSAKTATVSKGSSKKTTIKKLTKGKKYYFKVRAYKTVGSTKIYGAWSSVKSVKVK